jgi:hypothetical protein
MPFLFTPTFSGTKTWHKTRPCCIAYTYVWHGRTDGRTHRSDDVKFCWNKLVLPCITSVSTTGRLPCAAEMSASCQSDHVLADDLDPLVDPNINSTAEIQELLWGTNRYYAYGEWSVSWYSLRTVESINGPNYSWYGYGTNFYGFRWLLKLSSHREASH